MWEGSEDCSGVGTEMCGGIEGTSLWTSSYAGGAMIDASSPPLGSRVMWPFI